MALTCTPLQTCPLLPECAASSPGHHLSKRFYRNLPVGPPASTPLHHCEPTPGTRFLLYTAVFLFKTTYQVTVPLLKTPNDFILHISSTPFSGQ